VGLDAHQHRSAAAEDLVQAQALHQALAGAIEYGQHAAGALGGGLNPAPQGGTGRAAQGRQENGEQGARLLQAQAHGRRADGKLLVLLRTAFQRFLQPVPQLTVLRPELLHLLQQRLPGGARGTGLADRLLDLGGMGRNGLAATADPAGLMGNFPMRTDQGGRRVADPSENG
jgi:hypothetical protein